MSEYAEIKIREMSIWDYRNYLDDVVGLIFSPTDLIIISDSAEDSEDEKSYQYPKYMYRSNVQKAKERLDALGYSLPKLEKEFKRDTEDLLELFRFSQTLTPNEEEAYIAAKGKLEKHVSYRKWMNAIKKVIKYELDNGNITFLKKEHDIAIKTMCDDLVFDSLRNDDPTYIYGMDLEYIDVGFIFRAILEYCEADDEVILDFTNLGDWADNSIEQGCVAAGNNEKTIVLVEGTSDKDRILDAVAFTDKIIFGRTNYSKEVSSFPNHKGYYNQCAKRVIKFCDEHGIAYHIKDGTLTELYEN